jgi:ubiquinone/menaquinone biosynthesis C-methylase UbiE
VGFRGPARRLYPERRVRTTSVLEILGFPLRFNSPIFVLTSDTDWAADACIEDLAAAAEQLGITPVFFATNASPALSRLEAAGKAEVGLHPNFRPGSTHGDSVDAVIDHVFGLFPQARGFRAHSFFDTFEITEIMKARGLEYDSNLCLATMPDIRPLKHVSGLTRFPIFWEDNVHWLRNEPWDVEAMLESFLTPGLKVLNVHPLNFALNVPDEVSYRSVSGSASATGLDEIARRRFAGPGTRTFVTALLERLKALGHRFYTLSEVLTMTRHAESETIAGREHRVSDDEYHQYRRASSEQRQAWLREMYDRHNPTDPYATSRDHNLRELEILAIERHLPAGRILDLGCGNGYTLLSLARARATSRMIGVDFSEQMINGARELLAREPRECAIEFVCDNAVTYVSQAADASVDAVITERFLLNLPEPATQRTVIQDIYRVLATGGRFIMCEGSLEGFRNLNESRTNLGLQAIAENSGDNPSAIRFEDAEIEAYCKGLGFSLEAKLGFRDYFLISRVLHPLLAAPQPVRFGARINELAREIQAGEDFAPGLGSNVVWVFRKSASQGSA